MCDCNVCSDLRRWESALELKTEDGRGAFEEIMGRLEGAETDATYWRMKYEGTWDAPDGIAEVVKQKRRELSRLLRIQREALRLPVRVTRNEVSGD